MNKRLESEVTSILCDSFLLFHFCCWYCCCCKIAPILSLLSSMVGDANGTICDCMRLSIATSWNMTCHWHMIDMSNACYQFCASFWGCCLFWLNMHYYTHTHSERNAKWSNLIWSGFNVSRFIPRANYINKLSLCSISGGTSYSSVRQKRNMPKCVNPKSSFWAAYPTHNIWHVTRYPLVLVCLRFGKLI